MKYIAIVLLMVFPLMAWGQTMTWVKESTFIEHSCNGPEHSQPDMTCYKLVYTADKTGTVTSYTTGFIVDCLQGRSTVTLNRSCLMNDDSEEVYGCDLIDKILITASGNGGFGKENMIMKKDQPIVLHHVCFDLQEGESLSIVENERIDLTVSLDEEGTGEFYTEFPDYTEVTVEPEYVTTSVNDLGDEEFDLRIFPNPVQGQLQYEITTSLNELKYNIVNVNGIEVMNWNPVPVTAKESVDVRDLTPGVYHFVVKNKDHRMDKKFIIIK